MVAQAAGLIPLVGRERERAEICQLLRAPSVRLLTLTGPGGIGKTRLGSQVVIHLAGDFGDVVCFVSLGALDDPTLVGLAIADNLARVQRGDSLDRGQLAA